MAAGRKFVDVGIHPPGRSGPAHAQTAVDALDGFDRVEMVREACTVTGRAKRDSGCFKHGASVGSPARRVKVGCGMDPWRGLVGSGRRRSSRRFVPVEDQDAFGFP